MSSLTTCPIMLALVTLLSFAGPAMAQPAEPLSARHSDPRAMLWMKGFPPPADKVIRFTDPDYFAFPKLRWTVCHFRELMPSVAVDNGSGAARDLLIAALMTKSWVAIGPEVVGKDVRA